MFCPLCKAEYKMEVTSCADCRAAIVPSREVANRAPISVLWQGYNQDHFGKLFDALRQAQIPCHGRSRAHSAGVLSFLPMALDRFFLRNARDVTKQMGWEIHVLESDLPLARSIAGQIGPP